MEIKTALVLSDVHYGDLAHMDKFGKGRPATAEDFQEVATGIIDAINDHHRKIDFIFILGDLTSRGSPGEFNEVFSFIKILSRLLSIDDSHVFYTYGNHDVDWKICDIERDSVDRHRAYCEAAANVGSIFAHDVDFTYRGPVVGSGVKHMEGLDLIVLNSGIECYSSQPVKHGKLGGNQFEWLESNLPNLVREKSTKVVMLHHHVMSLPYIKPISDLSTLEEGSNVLNVLGELGVDMVLHGHRHHPIVHTEIKSTWKRPMTFVCSGSFGVAASERASGRLPNTIHMVDFKASAGESEFDGLVTTYELDSALNWVPLLPNYNEYPLNHRQWFGAAEASQKAVGEIKNILQPIRAEKSLDLLKLPKYIDLPLSLRCLQHDKLNEWIVGETQKMGLEVTGKYPDKCIVTR